MKKYMRGLTAVAAAGALVLTGCAGTPVATGDGAGAAVATPGYDPATKTIRVGSLVPVSGIWAGAITNIQGMEAYFAQATADGGPLEGYTVVVDNQDTKYDPATAIPLFNGIKDDVALFSMMLGAPIIEALLPTMIDDGLLGVPAGIVPRFLREPNLVPTFPMLNTYHAAAVEYAAQEYDLADAPFCSLIVEDVFGDSILEAFDYTTNDLGLEVATQVRFAGNTEDFTAQVSALKNAGCEVVVIGGVGMIVQNFALKAVQLDFNPTVLSGNAAYNITIATGPGSDWIKEHVTYAMTGTDWEGDEAVGQGQMRDALDALDSETVPTANAYQTGWINAALTTEILVKALDSGDMSRANLLKISQTELGVVDDMGMGGGSYDYGKSVSDRTPPHLMSFFRVDSDTPAGLKLESYNFESNALKSYVASLD